MEKQERKIEDATHFGISKERMTGSSLPPRLEYRMVGNVVLNLILHLRREISVGGSTVGELTKGRAEVSFDVSLSRPLSSD